MEDIYEDEQLLKYLKRRGLPHWNRDKHKAEEAKAAHPEVEPHGDDIEKDGEKIAKAGSGKTALPWKDD